jgi:integrase
VASIARGSAGSKHVQEVTKQFDLYVYRCALLKVAPIPWHVNALVLHLREKCSAAGAATSAANWWSNLRAHVRRFQLGPEATPDQLAQIKLHIAAMERDFGVFKEEIPALMIADLERAAEAIQTGARSLALRTTLMYASIALACGLRPNEVADTRNPAKVVIRIGDVTFDEASATFPFGRIHILVRNRKRALATGQELGVAIRYTGEPPSAALDFVSLLRRHISAYKLPDSAPLYASLDKHGFVASNSDGEVKWITRELYAALLGELTLGAGLKKATPRQTRKGRATQMAADGVSTVVIERMMDHKSKKRPRSSQSATYVALATGPDAGDRDLTVAARGKRQVIGPQ